METISIHHGTVVNTDEMKGCAFDETLPVDEKLTLIMILCYVCIPRLNFKFNILDLLI